MGIQDRINEIESEMNRTQKNKKTEYHLGQLKARLAKLKNEVNAPKSNLQKTEGWEVGKSGDSRIALVGFPSVGKSTLLSLVTSTESRAAEHEFTTLDCIAGKLNYKGATIQVLDLPGIISGASSNLGRGRQVISIARTADMILMVLDPRRKNDRAVLERELFNMGIRLNKSKPDVSLTITTSGGINISSSVELTKTSENTIRAILKEYKINNCNLYVKEDISEDQVLDILNKNVVYMKCIYCYNKVDELTYEDFLQLANEENNAKENNFIMLSCQRKWNLDFLLEEIWRVLNLTRIYTKKKSNSPDFEAPVVLRSNSTVLDLCKGIHKDFYSDFKYAMVWGCSVKHNPQKVGLTHYLEDEDVVQIVLK
ncbi:Developmentally-regulated GTP-binding protein 2 [Nosema granulosis]|uniref:Developmentally-regulated GTP-binding protein 2 n=1 Tax=Nosema granulosis TaxID=83296 RepID=A0A9P6GY33_9MICR|nr:Developmentally-regulated GTP-binding protein 2 [Nosema granulosis]